MLEHNLTQDFQLPNVSQSCETGNRSAEAPDVET